MKKMYMLEDLDCANCAAKMEEAISKIDGVTYTWPRNSPWRPMTPATMTSWPKW